MTTKISIGSDPEFIILDKHRQLVPACEFFIIDACKDCSTCDNCGNERCTREEKDCSIDCWECDKCQDEIKSCEHCEGCDQKTDLYTSEIGTDCCEDVGYVLRDIVMKNT